MSLRFRPGLIERPLVMGLEPAVFGLLMLVDAFIIWGTWSGFGDLVSSVMLVAMSPVLVGAAFRRDPWRGVCLSRYILSPNYLVRHRRWVSRPGGRP